MGRKNNLFHRACIVLMLLFVSSFVACGVSVAVEDTNDMVNSDMDLQISEQPDKNNMTEAEEKLSTDLLELLRTTRSGSSTGAIINSDEQDLVHVYVYLYKGNNTDVIAPIVQEITNWDEETSVAVAWVSVNRLEELALLEEVKNIRTVIPPVVNNGSATNEDNISTDAEKGNYLEDGNWIKIIGVLLFTAIVFKKRSE